MTERREPPAEPGSHPPIAAPPELTPVQQAHSSYSDHATTCPACRDIDRGRCTDGEQLWRAWSEACDEAYRQLHGGTP